MNRKVVLLCLLLGLACAPPRPVEPKSCSKKSLKPLPVVKEKEGEVFDAVTAPELRYRQRYREVSPARWMPSSPGPTRSIPIP